MIQIFQFKVEVGVAFVLTLTDPQSQLHHANFSQLDMCLGIFFLSIHPLLHVNLCLGHR